jgi:hypothetical protein
VIPAVLFSFMNSNWFCQNESTWLIQAREQPSRNAWLGA